MTRPSIHELIQDKPFRNQFVKTERKTFKRDDETERILFERWKSADLALQKMEEIRDAHEPKTLNEEWHQLFKMALESIPLAKERARRCWLDYIGGNDDY